MLTWLLVGQFISVIRYTMNMFVLFLAVIAPNRKQEEDLQVSIHVNPNLDDMSVSVVLLCVIASIT